MNANLVLLAKSGKQKVFPLPSNVTVIGRRHNCDLRIPLESVSRRHCQLNYDSDHLTVRDLGSRNGTLLNGAKVAEESEVRAGDMLQIGEVLFALQINGQPESIERPSAAAPATPDEGDDTAIASLDEDNDLDIDFESSGDLGELDNLDDDIDLESL